ncbi:MAG TPA: NCS2 family permease, partial [Cyclobacteriaceae bacterium]|nr:NCS2 family permease [Cyclobacteriaceae bacterium]
MINRFFDISGRGSTIRREIIGGVTTFLTMSYIIFLHPNMLSETGMDKGALITITCLASFFGTLLFGLWVKVPFAMAPGLGLNSYFTYTIVLGMGIDWKTALGIVFISGVLFVALTIIGIREKLVNSVPLSLRLAVPAGIGLLITFVGLKNLGLIISNESTFLALGSLTPTVLIGFAGLILTALLEIKKIPGSILSGIVLSVIIALLFNYISPPAEIFSSPPSPAPITFKLDIPGALQISFIGAIFSFLYIALFDSIGTLIACAYEAGLVEPDGKIKNIGKMLGSDALATMTGAVLGTSTVTAYIESASGISSGARTGLASVVTAGLFLLSPFLAPMIKIVPGYATAPALIIVGVYMFKTIAKIDFTDFLNGFPAFLTII